MAQAVRGGKGRTRGQVMWRSDEIRWMCAALERIGISGLRVGREEKRNGMVVNSGAVRYFGAKLPGRLVWCMLWSTALMLLVPTAEVKEGVRKTGQDRVVGEG